MCFQCHIGYNIPTFLEEAGFSKDTNQKRLENWEKREREREREPRLWKLAGRVQVMLAHGS